MDKYVVAAASVRLAREIATGVVVAQPMAQAADQAEAGKARRRAGVSRIFGASVYSLPEAPRMRDSPVDRAPASRIVTRWRRDMSDGCSVPSFLRLFTPKETPTECAVCERHDELYYYGGSRALRRAADAEFRSGMVGAGMPRLKSWMYWAAVRVGGVPWLRVKGVSWSFADEHFKYAAKPATPSIDA